MDSFVKRKRGEIEVDKPEAAQEFEEEDLIIEQPEDISSSELKRTKQCRTSLWRTSQILHIICLRIRDSRS